MAGAAPLIEWYIARDGQQYGPLSDPEMRKFVELGHLRPSDLVWRYGFADWRPAPAVFPLPAPAPQRRPEPPRQAHRPEPQPRQPRPEPQQPRREPARPASRDPHHPHHYGTDPARMAATPAVVTSPYEDEDDDYSDDDFLPDQPRRGFRRMAMVAALIAILGGAMWLAVDLVPSPTRLVSLIEAPKSPSGEPPDEDSAVETSAGQPLQTANADPEALDATFESTPLWQLIRREFPDWYEQRVKEAAQLKAEGRDDAFIERQLTENVVALRREHAEQALSASPAALRGIAESFLNNLQQLSAESVQACYGFISQGETSPQVLALMGSPDHHERLQRQVTAVFEAVAEGRRSPQTHVPPRPADYQALTQALTDRGWTDRDVQLFSNPRALAQAPPQEVCRLVQDWFAAQLSIPDEDIQLRLLIESLKPVVAG